MEERDKRQVQISVIVPVYNAQGWLRQALDSLRAQSFGDFEALMIDDGSDDSSGAICREYAARDKRFRYFHQSNQGVSAARNKGLDLARGEWIAFLDADDLLLPDTLGILMEAAGTTGCRIAAGLYSHRIPEKKESEAVRTRTVTSTEAIRMGLYQKRILNSPCGILFHKNVFDTPEALRFRKCRYEDLDLFYRAFERVREICLIDNVVYYYRDHAGSFINTWSDSRLDALDVTDRIVSHMKAHHPELTEAALDRQFSAHCNILAEMIKAGVRDRAAAERCMEVIRQRRGAELRDRNVRLKNKLGALASYALLPLLPIIRTICR